MPNSLSWEWKDSNRCWWSVEAWPLGEVTNVKDWNLAGDWRWGFMVFNEAKERVWSGFHDGQLDQPPKLRHLLCEWQQEVNQIVLDGAIDETRKRFSDANGLQ